MKTLSKMTRCVMLGLLCAVLVLSFTLTACDNTPANTKETTADTSTTVEEQETTTVDETTTDDETSETESSSEEESSSVAVREINFGFGEPTQELWGQGGSPLWAADGRSSSRWATSDVNKYSTAVNIAKVNAAFNGNSARIWSHTDEICWPVYPNKTEDYLSPGGFSVLQQVINDLYDNGVTNIIYQSGIVNSYATRTHYDPKANKWYSMWEAMSLAAETGYVPDAHLGLATLPGDDGSVSGISYEDFLDLQREYFRQIALKLEHISYIEILNEMECGMMLYRCYIEDGTIPPIEVSAQIAMDVCKMATEGIKLAGKENEIKVLMPALACVSGMDDRYDTIEYLKAEYDYIKNYGTKNHGTDDPDDYFQIVNYHPYVFLSSGVSTTNYLYLTEGQRNTLQTAEVLGKRWREYTESIRDICIQNGDEEKPFFITEVGMASYPKGNGLEHAMWKDYTKNTLERQTMMFQTIYDIIQSMPYIDTVIFFRLGDYSPSSIGNPFVSYGEASYGILDVFGKLKDIGKNLYTILNNGSEDYSKVLDVIQEMKGKK